MQVSQIDGSYPMMGPNGSAYGDGFALVRDGGRIEHLSDFDALFEALEKLISR